MARVTISYDLTDVQETIREFSRLYGLHGHKLSRCARERIDRLAIGEIRLIEFGDVQEGFLPVYPSGALLAALADLRVVSNGTA